MKRLRRSQTKRRGLSGQLVTSAVVDQIGLFGMARWPIDFTKLLGLVVIVVGFAEIVNLTKAVSRTPTTRGCRAVPHRTAACP